MTFFYSILKYRHRQSPNVPNSKLGGIMSKEKFIYSIGLVITIFSICFITSIDFEKSVELATILKIYGSFLAVAILGVVFILIGNNFEEYSRVKFSSIYAVKNIFNRYRYNSLIEIFPVWETLHILYLEGTSVHDYNTNAAFRRIKR